MNSNSGVVGGRDIPVWCITALRFCIPCRDVGSISNLGGTTLRGHFFP